MRWDIDLVKEINESSYIDYKRIWANCFSLGYLSHDITDKFALISLICYVTYKLRLKTRNGDYYDVIKKLADNKLSEQSIRKLAVTCEDFGYGCSEFPVFGLSSKEIIPKIKELMSNIIPF